MRNFREQISALKKPIIIGIAGDSGSGKTTYSNGIRRLLGVDLVQTITLDGYHKENREERKISGRLPLDPEANKLDLVLEHLKKLKQGNRIELPIYNHESGVFDPPVEFTPGPIIIVEGLHALYPDFIQYYDFSIYVDPSREVKWQWKYTRDMVVRHHEKNELSDEMLLRETLYKRFIDFQKTNANTIVKIKESIMKDFARYESITKIPAETFKVELIMQPPANGEKLAAEIMHFELPTLFSGIGDPFLLASIPSLYWGRRMSVIHIDGAISENTILELEKHIASTTGIAVDEMLKRMPKALEHEQLTGVQFAQLLIGWRFLERLKMILTNNQ